MGNIDNVESYSYNDLSLIQVELTTITPDDEVEQCWDMLRRKVSDACALLPDGSEHPYRERRLRQCIRNVLRTDR